MSDPIDIVTRLSGMSADHGPDGWPAVRMRDITALCEEVTRLRAELAEAQQLARDDFDLRAEQRDERDRLRAALAQAAPGREPVAWMRQWFFDGEAPKKERNENGRLAWPAKFKFLQVTAGKVLADDVPLYAHPSPAYREPLTDAQLAQGLRAAIDIPTAHEAAAFRKGARWAWGVKLADSGATGGTKGAA